MGVGLEPFALRQDGTDLRVLREETAQVLGSLLVRLAARLMAGLWRSADAEGLAPPVGLDIRRPRDRMVDELASAAILDIRLARWLDALIADRLWPQPSLRRRLRAAMALYALGASRRLRAARIDRAAA